jgi:isoleucyl-tRNA synthetase
MEAPEGAFRSEETEMAVHVAAAEGEKCERCWIFDETVGQVSEHPTFCKRCAAVLANE